MLLGNYLRGTPVTPLGVPAFWSGTTKLDLQLEIQSVSGAWLLIPVPEGPKMGSGRPLPLLLFAAHPPQQNKLPIETPQA